MSWLSKQISSGTAFIDKQFGSKLAAKYRQIDPIARMMGENYQRHIFHVVASGGIGTGYIADYYSGMNRGQDSKTALRHTYQNLTKSAAILATVYVSVVAAPASGATAGTGAGAGAGGAAGASVAGAGTSGAAAAGGSAITGISAAPVATGTVSGSLAGVNVATGVAGGTATVAGGATLPAAVSATSLAGGAAAAAPTAATSFGGTLWNGAKAVGGFAEKHPLITYGLLQTGGSMLASANTPTQAEEYEQILEAKRRANRYDSGIEGGAKPVITPTFRMPTQQASVMTPQQTLAAGGFSYTPGLLQNAPADTSLIRRAGY